MKQSDRSLLTVLFTDIVGSTERAAELGDRAWRALLERHHAIVRRELARHGGEELNTLGDGFVARFNDPGRAITGACAIRERVREIGLEVRSGLHIGQVEGGGREIAGIAVHIGARVAARAGPGEVVVSRSVHDTVQGGGFAFEDLGPHELQGVPGKWRLFRVTALPEEVAVSAGEREDVSAARRAWHGLIAAVRRGRFQPIAAAGALLVVTVIVLVALLRDCGAGRAPPDALAEDAAPGIAVLPFDVRGADEDVWREGMVDVLSKNLDGVAGLRAIDSRTVLARWREGVPGGAVPDLRAALDVARRTGARYGILGSVVVAGDRLRVVADVYDLPTGRRLDEAQAEGAADAVFDVVDHFSGEVLRSIVEERGEMPELDLARATTASLSALKAYLEGEARLRRGEFDDAVRAYRRAVEADSTFALAWLRLSIAYGWLPRPEFELGEEAAARAARLADRLPERDALLARGWHAFERRSPEGLETLRTAARKYPDDTLAWYLLADFLYHQGGGLLVDPAESRRGFARAIDLDPTFAPAYIHTINATLRTEPDSARVAGLVERYRRLAPGTAGARGFDLVHAIAFGDDSTRAITVAALDTVSEIFLPFTANLNLDHPRFLDRKVALYTAALSRPDPFEAHVGAIYLALARFYHGEIDAALEAVRHPAVGTDEARLLYRAQVARLPVPEERIEQALAGSRTAEPTVFWEPTGGAQFLWGAWAVERGRREEYEQARADLRTIAGEATAGADSLAASWAEGMASGLEGFAAWRDGRRDKAERILDEARLQTAGGIASTTPNQIIRWWLAELALESGNLERAAVLFLSLSHGEAILTDPMAVLGLARVQEELGRLEEARDNYEWFALAWRDADPELRYLLEEARRGALRLGGLRE